jgi:hypothetical protein
VADGELWEKEQAESLQAADDKKVIAVDDISGVSGVRFNAVVLQTPPARTQAATDVKNAKVILDSDGFMPDEETMCWLSVSDLARSGIFANDFVGLVVPADKSSLRTHESLFILLGPHSVCTRSCRKPCQARAGQSRRSTGRPGRQ